MTVEEERFLARWSRLKRGDARELDDAAKPAAPASALLTEAPGEPPLPPLPPLESLTPESDFTAFMSAKVADSLRRAALKKLFRHPDINVPDPFEPFCDDLTGGEPIPDEMLKSLLEARDAILRRPEPQAGQAQPQAPEAREHHPEPEPQAPEARERQPEPEAQAPEPTDDAGRQDA